MARSISRSGKARDERFRAGELDDLLVKAVVIVNFNGGL